MKDIGELGVSATSEAPTVAAGEGPPWFSVDKTNYPHTYAVLDAHSDAAGFGSGHTGYALDVEWEARLPAVERGIQSLTPDDLAALKEGSVESRQNLAQRSEDLAEVHRMLTIFCDDGEI